jgi:hypothetical protein
MVVEDWMTAKKRRDGRTSFDDDAYIELVAYEVPVSERFPDGVKYRFQYVGAGGEPTLRFDNFPDHPDTPLHHVHRPDGSVEGVPWHGLDTHVGRFLELVFQYRTLR